MLVQVQWASDVPAGWEAHDLVTSGDVAALASLGRPLNAHSIAPGTINEGWDHVTFLPEAGQVVRWNDDPEDWPNPWGQVLDVDGAVTWYSTPGSEEDIYQRSIGLEPLPWDQFPLPDPAVVLHGLWLTDSLFEAHQGARA